MPEPPAPITTASSGSGWTRPYSFFSRIGRPWPSSELAGLVKAAGWLGPLMIRSALALLLSAMQMTLPGRGTGGSHSRSPAGTVRNGSSSTAGRSRISRCMVIPRSSRIARLSSSGQATTTRSAPSTRTVPSFISSPPRRS